MSTLSLTSALGGVGIELHAPATLPPRKRTGTNYTIITVWVNNDGFNPFFKSCTFSIFANVNILRVYCFDRPVPVAARFKEYVYGCSPAEIVGFESHRGHGCLSVVSVVCCQVYVCATR